MENSTIKNKLNKEIEDLIQKQKADLKQYCRTADNNIDS